MHGFIRCLRSIANKKVSVFGYRNLRQIPREQILCDVCIQQVDLPFLHQDASGIDSTKTLSRSLLEKFNKCCYYFYFQTFPPVFPKLEKYKFQLDTFDFTPFLLYLPLPMASSTFCYCETLLPCYLTGQNINCVHSDALNLVVTVYR